MLTIYGHIKQPVQWAKWVQVQEDQFEESQITISQDFMYQASVKYTKIASSDSGFHGSMKTLQDDIVAMVAAVKKHKTLPTNAKHDAKSTGLRSRSSAKWPPFIKHFKALNTADAIHYKVGDSKEWDGKTWYFCDTQPQGQNQMAHTLPSSVTHTNVGSNPRVAPQPLPLTPLLPCHQTSICHPLTE